MSYLVMQTLTMVLGRTIGCKGEVGDKGDTVDGALWMWAFTGVMALGKLA